MHIANEAKLGGKITQRILAETLRTAGEHDYLFSVNLTAADVESDEERSRIVRLLEANPHSAPRIIFELLESEEFEDYDAVDDFINRVKRHGCKVAIDDFGSGYSNFEKTLKMDIDLLKIDGSLVRRIDHDRHSELIVRTILDFTRYAGIETVAEYVHSRTVFEKVRSLGFDYAQGYFIGKPAPGLLPENDLSSPK
jgi:EAL domain-containing protein (putative c-di-GMP-specific phosphodiesterase class I)